MSKTIHTIEMLGMYSTEIDVLKKMREDSSYVPSREEAEMFFVHHASCCESYRYYAREARDSKMVTDRVSRKLRKLKARLTELYAWKRAYNTMVKGGAIGVAEMDLSKCQGCDDTKGWDLSLNGHSISRPCPVCSQPPKVAG